MSVAGRNLTVAMTGASGAVFARELLRALEADERVTNVNFVPSENSLRVLAEELGLNGRNSLVEKLLGDPADEAATQPRITQQQQTQQRPTQIGQSKIRQLAEGDIGANIASGSYPADAMIVLPCSMGTLAGIAHGLASNLIERAADVSLKERRPLILCVRETPFNKIHLRNMQIAADAGAVIFPVIPSFYNRPTSSDEMAKQFVYRVLAGIGLPHADAYVWKPDA